jgi:uncharacterized protein
MKSNETTHDMNASSEPSAPVVIRGHMLLCLQGFRGEGYSPGFVENMAAIHTRLGKEPEIKVRMTDTPDHICEACPNLKGGCTLRGPDFEQHIVSQDRHVLSLLGLKVGEEVTWTKVLNRIGLTMRGEMLGEICGGCQWLSLGYCQEGIERLRH